MHRLIVEVQPDERQALRTFCAAKGCSYSLLIRKLLELAYRGAVPKLDEALAKDERPVINVTVSGGLKKVRTVRLHPNGGPYKGDMTEAEYERAKWLWNRGKIKDGDPVPEVA